MAWAAPALCKVVTASTGTNDYVLSDPSSQGPYRTDVQAVADGSLANGQTVHYLARDTTVTNDASFEEGYGVYTSATRTVARTAGNVIDSDGGPGVLKSWGLSGQRDFYILGVLDGSDIPSSLHATFASNLGLPTLSAANVFTADQKVKKVGAGANIRSGSNVSATLADVGRFTFLGHNSSGTEKEPGFFSMQWTDATAGSEDSFGRGVVIVGGTAAESFKFDGSGLKTPAGTYYDAIPTGSVLLSESVWPGWTRSDVTGGRLIKLATSADTLGASGGSDDPFDGNWGTAGHTLTISQIPAHTHTRQIISGSPSGLFGLAEGDTALSGPAGGSTGSGGSHFHTMVTPNYRVMGRIVKS